MYPADKPRIDEAARPRIFIGSSTESLAVADTLQVLLSEKFEVHVWRFALEATTIVLDRLLEAKTNYQYAIFIFTPDDLANIRENKVLVTRDNVIFEAGLFMSHLGRRRTFIVIPEARAKAPQVHLLSDFSGLICLKYHSPTGFTSSEWNACLGPVSVQIGHRIEEERMSGTGRILALRGRWRGNVTQDANPRLPVTKYDCDSEFDLDGNYVVGYLNLQPTRRIPGWPKVLEFKLRGAFVHERFFKMEYTYVDPAAIQLGFMLLDLNTQGTKLMGRFLGFGALSQQLVSGFIKLEKRKS
jgi:hypothetical protein